MMRSWLKKPIQILVAIFSVALFTALFVPLPAQGLPVPFKAVTFHENDSLSDNTSTFQSLNAPSDLTLFADLSPAFSNPGYIFDGWTTQSNGAGTFYPDGSPYSFTADLDLFAEWTQSYSSVTFMENASTSDSVSSYESLNAPSGLTPFANLSPNFSKAGYTFNNWNTSPDGGGTSYANAALYGFSGDLTLYAQWIQNTSTTTTTTTTPGTLITVSFNDGGGTGNLSPVTVNSGSSVQLPITGSLTNVGYVQTGWFTASTGGSLVGLGGAYFLPTTSVTLFAQWEANATTTISFSTNGGTGSIAPIASASGSSLTLPTGDGLLDTGFTFAGWSPTSTSQSMVYSPGAPYQVTSSATLYAVWTVASKAPVVSKLAGAIGPFVPGSAVLGHALKLQIHDIASVMKARDYASVSMFGYALANEKVARVSTLGARRANSVENYLRLVLVELHIKPMAMHSTGEGLIKGTSNKAFRRVEVFLKL